MFVTPWILGNSRHQSLNSAGHGLKARCAKTPKVCKVRMGYALKIRPDSIPSRPVNNDDLEGVLKETGPTALAIREWKAAGLALPDEARMRVTRNARVVQAVRDAGLDAVLLYDVCNIRFATDLTAVSGILWNMHFPCRAALVCADGHTLVFDGYAKYMSPTEVVDDYEAGGALFYYAAGDKLEEDARKLASHIHSVARAHGQGGSILRLAIDTCPLVLHKALLDLDLNVVDAGRMMEMSKAVKGPDEIAALRCAMHSTQQAALAMEAAAKPGMSECDVWAVLHAEHVRRGGEWMECRLLTSGPRTNPWYQQCGTRIVQDGELIAYDTDLIGPYGLLCDFSRTFWVGDGKPTPAMKHCFEVAREHIATNAEMLKPGLHTDEMTFGGHMLPEEFVPNRYTSKFHGSGFSYEFPRILYPEDYKKERVDMHMKAGMTMCAEALVGFEGGEFSIKLEDQVLITEDGVENLTSMPFDDRFN